MIQRVISGGQTGVDQAALRAAKACGIPTGGWCPLGFLTEAGPMPALADFGLAEMPTADYPPRTRKNIEESDATLTLITHIRQLFGGTSFTITECRRQAKPRLTHNMANGMAEPLAWLRRIDPYTLNVAGPRESKVPGIGKTAEAFLVELFKALGEDHIP
jgi:hypothetical protein